MRIVAWNCNVLLITTQNTQEQSPGGSQKVCNLIVTNKRPIK